MPWRVRLRQFCKGSASPMQPSEYIEFLPKKCCRSRSAAPPPCNAEFSFLDLIFHSHPFFEVESPLVPLSESGLPCHCRLALSLYGLNRLLDTHPDVK